MVPRVSQLANIPMIRGPSHIKNETLFEHNMKRKLFRTLKTTNTNFSESTPSGRFGFSYS